MILYFQDNERAVSREEGMALAEEHKCSFLECSAKTKENVLQCFKELILKVHHQDSTNKCFSHIVSFWICFTVVDQSWFSDYAY